jgi:hypothetical protein
MLKQTPNITSKEMEIGLAMMKNSWILWLFFL